MALPKLLVGITGSIAATKTIELINLLSNKYEINIICTQEGLKYIDNDSYKKYKTNYLISDNTSDSLRRVIKNIPNVIPI